MSNEDDFVNNNLRISCADLVALVTEYLEDALDQTDLDRFEQHTSGCEPCQVYVDQIRRTIHIANTARDDTVALRPDNFDTLITEFEQLGQDRG